MSQRSLQILAVACAVGLLGCGGTDESDTAMPETPSPASVDTGVPATGAESVPAAGAGTATVSLTGADVSVSGDFPARLCGGTFALGEGVAYQTRAGDWQITIASETRESGDIPLNTPDGSVNVVVAANGPGVQYVRGPRNGGSLEISEDFRRAEADLELRSVIGRDTARLVATFICEPGT
jgi:hypothetical protein